MAVFGELKIYIAYATKGLQVTYEQDPALYEWAETGVGAAVGWELGCLCGSVSG